MGKIDELILKLCPDGVEYRTLGDIGRVCMCKRIYKEQTESVGDIPFYKIGTFGGTPDAFISRDIYKDYTEKYPFPKKGDILISAAGTIGRTVIYDGEPAYFQDSNIVWIDNDERLIKNSFLYYVYSLGKWAASEGGTITRLYNDNIRKTRLPIPPLPVQQEIVRILDKFAALETELETKLEAELEARKKQYDYYLDELFTFSSDVECKSLCEIATDIYRGSGIKRDQVIVTGTPCVRYGEIYTTYHIWFDACVSHTDPKDISSKKYFEYGDILFAITGERVDEIAKSCVYVGHEKCLAGGDIVVMKHNQNPKYMAYVLSTTGAQTQKSKGKVKSKVVHSSVPALKAIEIPVPPREEQERIVAILDHFDAIVNDITHDLSAEIEARHIQYEYYRDKLLTFKEKVS
jgi:type I restriction enzyme S subunit